MELCVLCRHGESTYNTAGLTNGDPSVEVGLSPRGREQAAALADRLRDVHLDLVLHSRFPRAIETARLAVGERAPRVCEPLLDDIRCGEMEGVPVQDDHGWRSCRGRDRRPRDGESIRDASLRIADGLEKVANRPEPAIAVFTHELVVRYALNAAEDGADIAFPWREVPNATPFYLEREALVRAVGRIRSCANGPWGSAVPGLAANGG